MELLLTSAEMDEGTIDLQLPSDIVIISSNGSDGRSTESTPGAQPFPARSPDGNPSSVPRDVNPVDDAPIRAPQGDSLEDDINPVTAVTSSGVGGLDSLSRRSPVAAGLPPSLSSAGHSPSASFVIDPDVFQAIETSLWPAQEVEPDPEPVEAMTSDALRSMMRTINQDLVEAQFWLSILAREAVHARPLLSLDVTALGLVFPEAGSVFTHAIGSVFALCFRSSRASEAIRLCHELVHAHHPHVSPVLACCSNEDGTAVLSSQHSDSECLSHVLSSDAAAASFSALQRVVALVAIARGLHFLATVCPVSVLKAIGQMTAWCCVAASFPEDCLPPVRSVSPSVSESGASTGVAFWKLDLARCVARSSVLESPLHTHPVHALGTLILRVCFGLCDASSPHFLANVSVITSALATLSRTVSVEGSALETLPDTVLSTMRSVCDARLTSGWPPLLCEALCVLGVQARQMCTPVSSAGEGASVDQGVAAAALRRVCDRLHALSSRFFTQHTFPSPLPVRLILSRPSAMYNML